MQLRGRGGGDYQGIGYKQKKKIVFLLLHYLSGSLEVHVNIG